MQFIFSRDRDALYAYVVKTINQEVTTRRQTLLGLATGATFEPVYDLWIKTGLGCQPESLHTVNLDEYYPIDRQAPQSFYSYMRQRVFAPLRLLPEQTHVLQGETHDPEGECQRFETQIKALGGVDLQLLGIGRNGHIGFNEPAESFTPTTHKTMLTDATIKDNLRYFDSLESMPKEALTMGIGTIMQSKKILLLIIGASKQEAVKALITGEITPKCPASILQLHTDCTVLIDEDAGKYLDWSKGTIL
jgi:glucosamine-6-phosphate deaminase